MTAILYVKDDGIYTDHLYVDTDNVYAYPNKNFDHKVYRSKNDQFVYALSGRWVFEYDKNRNDIEKMLHDFLIKSNKIIKANTLPGDEKFLNGYKLASGTLFILTLDKLFVVDFDNNVTYVHILDNEDLDYYGIGSGGLVAEAVLRLTGDPIIAIKHCTVVLSTCGLTDKINGGNPDYQPQSTLKLLAKDDITSLLDACDHR